MKRVFNKVGAPEQKFEYIIFSKLKILELLKKIINNVDGENLGSFNNFS